MNNTMSEQEKMRSRDLQIIEFVRNFVQLNHRPPGLGVIQEALGFSGRNNVRDALVRLRNEGLVKWEPNLQGTLRLTEGSPFGVPLKVYSLPASGWYKDRLKPEFKKRSEKNE